MNLTCALLRRHDWSHWTQDPTDPTESRVCMRCWRLHERALPLVPVETPAPLPATESGKWQPGDGSVTITLDGDTVVHRLPALDLDHAHTHRADLLGRRALEDRYLTVCQYLREIRTDRDQLERANALLVAKVNELRAEIKRLRGEDRG